MLVPLLREGEGLAMTPRELVFVFATAEGASAFHRWASAYFAGALDGSGSKLLPDRRVKVKGFYGQETPMFKVQAGELGGKVDLVSTRWSLEETVMKEVSP